MFKQGQITVIDDFIDKDYQEKIKRELIGGFDSKKNYHDSNFPWFYIEDVTAAGDSDSQHRPGLGHQYVEFDDVSPGIVVSEHHELMIPMLRKVGFTVGIRDVKVLQGRSFLQFPVKERGEIDLPHIDICNKIHIVGLYYVMDSDGDTIIYNEREKDRPDGIYTIKERVTPKQGRAVLFDGWLMHTAAQPINNVRCIVIYNLD